jgi:hypothetical protein
MAPFVCMKEVRTEYHQACDIGICLRKADRVDLYMNSYTAQNSLGSLTLD